MKTLKTSKSAKSIGIGQIKLQKFQVFLIAILVVIVAAIGWIIISEKPPTENIYNDSTNNNYKNTPSTNNTPSERQIITDSRYWLLETYNTYNKNPESGAVSKVSSNTYTLFAGEKITAAEIAKGTSIDPLKIGFECVPEIECGFWNVTVKKNVDVKIQVTCDFSQCIIRYRTP